MSKLKEKAKIAIKFPKFIPKMSAFASFLWIIVDTIYIQIIIGFDVLLPPIGEFRTFIHEMKTCLKFLDPHLGI